MYTAQNLDEISGGQLSPEHIDRTLRALNGFAALFGKDWVEKEIVVQFLNDKLIVATLKKDKIYGGIIDVERLVSLWEDLEQLSGHPGFEGLTAKLKNGVRFDNVDLEVSLVATISRLGSTVELEPSVNGGPKKADCRFKVPTSHDWVYVEITRKIPSKNQKIIDTRGKELAKLASEIDPQRRCVVVIKKVVNNDEYFEITNWLAKQPGEGTFKNTAVFFTLPHTVDDSPTALSHVSGPVSVRQFGNISTGSFGVAYLHVPDGGARNKLLDKMKQQPTNQQSVLFIDVSSIAGGFEDWYNQINLSDELKHFSAIVLLRAGIFSDGLKREMRIVKSPNSANPMSKMTEQFLSQLANSNISFSLMR